ncbi:MAG: hypothetical protein PHP79_05905 [Clostridia bacterium]|nr:hypothetical protein [Clostridia bacterium]
MPYNPVMEVSVGDPLTVGADGATGVVLSAIMVFYTVLASLTPLLFPIKASKVKILQNIL